MTVRITRQYNKYKITFSPGIQGLRGFSVHASDFDEIFTSIKHWFGEPHEKAVCLICLKYNLK